MLAKPFPEQFDAYCARARDLVPYLDLEELSREAWFAEERSRLQGRIRPDTAGAERRVHDVFHEAFLKASSPYEPQSRDVEPAPNRQGLCSFPAVTTHRSGQHPEEPRAGRNVKAW